MMTGFREINGPKSFSSMSQLDQPQPRSNHAFRLRAGHNNNFGMASSKKALSSSRSNSSSNLSQTRNNADSPMDISNSSRTSSSTEDQNGNRKNKNNHSNSSRMVSPTRPLFNTTAHRTRVVYLGCLPLSAQSSDLASLQLPLKDLYFDHIEAPELTANSTLEITDTGLRISYDESKEIFNPFPTIAVWAAVRFIYKREQQNNNNSNNNQRFSFAFLPLISDPGDAEKKQLFNPLSKKDLKLAASHEHPAMFACIMRRNGVPKQLDCHGFICDGKEDAILIASNLYKSLMDQMKKQQMTTEQQQQQQVPNNLSRPARNRRKKRKSTEDSGSNKSSLTQSSGGNITNSSKVSNNNGSGNNVNTRERRIRRSQSEKFLDEELDQRRVKRR